MADIKTPIVRTAITEARTVITKPRLLSSVPADMGARFWWNAGRIAPVADGAVVATWTDLINGTSLTQATENLKPLYYASGKGGRPYLLFGVATGAQLVGTAFGMKDYTAITVVIIQTPTASSATGDVGSLFLRLGASVNWIIGSSTIDFTPETDMLGLTNPNKRIGTSYTNNSWNAGDTHVRIFTQTSNTNALHMNGSSKTFDLSYGGGAPTDNFTPSAFAGAKSDELAIQTGTTAYIETKLYEVMIFNRALSAEERASLQTYATSIYGTLPT